MLEGGTIENVSKRLRILAVLTFVVSPVLAWFSILASDDTAVFASLSRMIWYSGSAIRIFLAMVALFVPMLIAFFMAHDLSGLTKAQKWICRACMIASCVVLYIGAMEMMPSDGNSSKRKN